MSTLKKSKRNFKYFNFSIQLENDFVQGVCFEPNLHQDLTLKQELQRPIKVSHYSVKESTLNKDGFSIVVNRRTKLENYDDCHFEYKEPEQQNPVRICEIQDLKEYDIISTVGKVHIVGQPKKIKLDDDRELRKLDCNIADSSGAVKLTVWENAISEIDDDKYYQITNARVRCYQSEMFLSISTDTVISEVKCDKDKFPVVSELYDETTTNQETTIDIDHFDGVQMISRYAKCKNQTCKKRLQNLQKLHTCEMCGMKQLITQTEQRFLSLGILVQKYNVTLRFNDKEARDVIDIFNHQQTGSGEVNADMTSESELAEAILLTGPLQITYNHLTRVVVSVIKVEK